jgi:hypothetical protein
MHTWPLPTGGDLLISSASSSKVAMKTQYALTWRASPASTILPSSLGSIPEKNKEGEKDGEEITKVMVATEEPTACCKVSIANTDNGVIVLIFAMWPRDIDNCFAHCFKSVVATLAALRVRDHFLKHLHSLFFIPGRSTKVDELNAIRITAVQQCYDQNELRILQSSP